jgi:hypothetical protein
MAFPALGAATEQPLGSARDCLPITASSANNVFGNAYDTTHGGDARACKAILASATSTVTFVGANGILRSNVVIPAGITPIQVIQVTVITGGSLWALI